MIQCFICQNSEWTPGTKGYRRCTRCGHELREEGQTQSYMVNEALDYDRVSRMDQRDRFQVALTVKAAQDHELIWDLGSGSGRFLFHVRKHFNNHLGVEITEDCVRFAREKLDLNIRPSIDQAEGTPTMVTMWHSLEHMPTPVIEKVLAGLRERMPESGRLLISVPNGGSRHFHFFGAHSVYYDLPNHVHQFSAESLEKLLAKYRFLPVSYHSSLMYAFFGSLLSFLNLVSPRHNYLYEELRRKTGFGLRKALIAAGFGVLAMLFIPLSLVSYVGAIIRPRDGSVLTVVFRPER